MDLKIEETIAATVRASIESHIQNINLDEIIAEHLQKQVSNVIINLTGKIFSQIVEKRDLESEVTALVNNILADQLFNLGRNKITELFQTPDFQKLIDKKVESLTTDIVYNFKFPSGSIHYSSINFENYTIPAASIDDGIIKRFNSTGIQDESSKTQLLITDDGIITTNNISAENLLIADSSFVKNITIEGDLQISGNVLPSNSLDTYIKNISTAVTKDVIKHSDIDLQEHNIVYGDKLILSNDTLGSQIINSNLRKVGNLNELYVEGQAIIHETLVVTNNKVGINTENASGALSVWDEDAEFTLVKHSPKTIFAGSTRITDVVMGSNNAEQIKLKSDGAIELNGSLRFNGILISVENRIPERVGEPGEIAILRDGTAIYRCLGQNSWGKIL